MAHSLEFELSGSVKASDGEKRLSVACRAPHVTLAQIVGWAPLMLEGTATLEGCADRVPLLWGSIVEVGPPLHRWIRYQLVFRDEAHHTYRFFGESRVSVASLGRSLLVAEGTLFRSGEPLGGATLRLTLPRPAFIL